MAGKKRQSSARATPAAAEAALVELRRLVDGPASAEVIEAIRAALRSGHALVAAFAARVVRERALGGFGRDLEAAFERFLRDPVKTDPSCHAKLAAVHALDECDHPDARTFVMAARHVQKEPSWGPPADTAAPLRARGVVALARRNYGDLPLLAAQLLADPEWPARQAAAEALAGHGSRECAGPLLLKLRSGDAEPLVTLACMNALLALAPDWALPELRDALLGKTSEAREPAALALGQSPREEALDVLIECLDVTVLAAERGAIVDAIALHRSERAVGFLFEQMATGGRAHAAAAALALAARRFEPGLEARVRAAAREHGLDLDAELERAFAGEPARQPAKR